MLLAVATYDLRDTKGAVDGTFERGVRATENDIVELNNERWRGRSSRDSAVCDSAKIWPEYHRQCPVTRQSYLQQFTGNVYECFDVIWEY